jgi:hypothetical protein
MDYIEKNDLYGQLLIIKNKLSVLKYIDAEARGVMDVPSEVKELLFEIKKSTSDTAKVLDDCISKLDTSMSKDN